MITDTAGTPIKDVLRAAALRVAERKNRRPDKHLELDNQGRPIFTIGTDKLGEKFRIFRSIKWYGRGKFDLPKVRTVHGVGRPLKIESTAWSDVDYASAVKRYGSQRKAAAALGISLGKLQRGIRK